MAVLNNWSPPRVSQLVVDANLVIANPHKIQADVIQAFGGRDIDFRNGLGLNSIKITPSSPPAHFVRGLATPEIYEYIAGNRVDFPDGINVDTIDDSGAAAISVLEDIALDTAKTLTADAILTDAITEKTGSANISLNSKVLVDHIGEKTASHDIVFDDDIQAQEDFEAKLTQDYLTAAAGDTDRYTSAGEETAVNPGASPGVPIKSVTVPGEYADPNCTFRITYTAKRSGTLGAGMKASICINGVVKSIGASLDEVYDVRSVDLAGITAGDVISINGYGDGAYTVYVKDFAVKSTDSVYTPAGASPTWT